MRVRAVLVGASALLLAWPLALYPAVLWILGRSRRSVTTFPQTPPLPTMTVVVPTYNEISNIVPRLENIASCDYPEGRLAVIVVDSASVDGTADAADRFAEAHPHANITVLREDKRAGKAAATNYALEHSATDLVVVTDAPTRFDPAALSIVARCFADPAVGAATGQFEIFEERTATQREEGLFWRIRNLLRRLEADVDSTPFLSGEFCCFRRELIKAIATDSIADDMNAALQVRRQGFRAIVDRRARFTEPRSAEVDNLLVRKVSRAAGGVQELMRHHDMIFRKEYGLFGMLILPSDVLYYIPLRLPALAIVGYGLAPRMRRHCLPIALITIAVLAVPSVRRRIGDAAYVAVLNEWLFVRAWHTVMSKQTEVLWPQEQRNTVPQAGWTADAKATGTLTDAS